jgi:hypothetical protein
MTYQELEQHYRDKTIAKLLMIGKNAKSKEEYNSEIKKMITQIEDAKLKTNDDEELRLADMAINEFKRCLDE